MFRNFTLIFVLAAAACGGKKPAPATANTASQDTAGEASGHEGHADMPAEMTKFHDVLAPRWHAEKGPQRMKDTCAAVPELRAHGDALAKVTPPMKANADTWTSSTRALVDSIAGLETTCNANDVASFEEAFHKVHESFHGLMAAAGVTHEGKGDHEHEHGDHGHHGDHKM